MQAFNLRKLCFESTCEHGEVKSPDMLRNKLGLSALKRKEADKKKTEEKKPYSLWRNENKKNRFLNVFHAKIIPVCSACECKKKQMSTVFSGMAELKHCLLWFSVRTNRRHWYLWNQLKSLYFKKDTLEMCAIEPDIKISFENPDGFDLSKLSELRQNCPDFNNMYAYLTNETLLDNGNYRTMSS